MYQCYVILKILLNSTVFIQFYKIWAEQIGTAISWAKVSDKTDWNTVASFHMIHFLHDNDDEWALSNVRYVYMYKTHDNDNITCLLLWLNANLNTNYSKLIGVTFHPDSF